MFAFAAHCSNTRGHPLKLVKSHARVNDRMFFFSLRIVDVWNSLPADVVTSNKYNQFKRGLLNVNFDCYVVLGPTSVMINFILLVPLILKSI
jgi:hypothetical protein